MKADNELVCNVCGKTLVVKNGIQQEDALKVKKEWGYFSEKDLEVHHFLICEECYDKLINSFVVPVCKTKKKEVL